MLHTETSPCIPEHGETVWRARLANTLCRPAAAARLHAVPAGPAPLPGHAAQQPVCGRDFCTYSLQDYHSQLVNLPAASMSAASPPGATCDGFIQDLFIHEASCHTGHSCRGLGQLLRPGDHPRVPEMPVLKKNPCEAHHCGCICAISRHS
uniref:Uncharacterized protein n=1 Tax=Salarias fasciatus TaxID=181472 RepID=A0A672HQ88_SALFA